MIDFRYHVVSLVSVFLALAIGVVLGAGPLRESIGDTLTNQVDALRRDKENLQLAVANRDEEIQRRDAFIAEVGGSVVAEELAGRSVVVVALPSAGPEGVDALTAQLESAGAAVTGRVGVTPEWADPDGAAFRRSLAGQLVGYLDQRPAAEAGAAGELAAVLAWAIAGTGTRTGTDSGTGEGEEGEEADQDAATVLEGLQGGGLITVDGDLAQRADLVLVTAGVPEAAVDGAPDPQDPAEWLPLVRALDAAASGSVVAGPLPDPADDTALVTAVRGSELAESVSTVDAADTPMGRINAVLALREQLTGASGHYGFAESATAVVPEIGGPPPAPSS